jgi:hypothetical protein
VGSLPPTDRLRYEVEWAADLQMLESRRERLAFAFGVLYSAFARRDRRGR